MTIMTILDIFLENDGEEIEFDRSQSPQISSRKLIADYGNRRNNFHKVNEVLGQGDLRQNPKKRSLGQDDLRHERSKSSGQGDLRQQRDRILSQGDSGLRQKRVLGQGGLRQQQELVLGQGDSGQQHKLASGQGDLRQQGNQVLSQGDSGRQHKMTSGQGDLRCKPKLVSGHGDLRQQQDPDGSPTQVYGERLVATDDQEELSEYQGDTRVKAYRSLVLKRRSRAASEGMVSLISECPSCHESLQISEEVSSRPSKDKSSIFSKKKKMDVHKVSETKGVLPKFKSLQFSDMSLMKWPTPAPKVNVLRRTTNDSVLDNGNSVGLYQQREKRFQAQMTKVQEDRGNMAMDLQREEVRNHRSSVALAVSREDPPTPDYLNIDSYRTQRPSRENRPSMEQCQELVQEKKMGISRGIPLHTFGSHIEHPVYHTKRKGPAQDPSQDDESHISRSSRARRDHTDDRQNLRRGFGPPDENPPSEPSDSGDGGGEDDDLEYDPEMKKMSKYFKLFSKMMKMNKHQDEDNKPKRLIKGSDLGFPKLKQWSHVTNHIHKCETLIKNLRYGKSQSGADRTKLGQMKIDLAYETVITNAFVVTLEGHSIHGTTQQIAYRTNGNWNDVVKHILNTFADPAKLEAEFTRQVTALRCDKASYVPTMWQKVADIIEAGMLAYNTDFQDGDAQAMNLFRKILHKLPLDVYKEVNQLSRLNYNNAYPHTLKYHQLEQIVLEAGRIIAWMEEDQKTGSQFAQLDSKKGAPKGVKIQSNDRVNFTNDSQNQNKGGQKYQGGKQHGDNKNKGKQNNQSYGNNQSKSSTSYNKGPSGQNSYQPNNGNVNNTAKQNLSVADNQTYMDFFNSAKRSQYPVCLIGRNVSKIPRKPAQAVLKSAAYLSAKGFPMLFALFENKAIAEETVEALKTKYGMFNYRLITAQVPRAPVTSARNSPGGQYA